jgi:hypothetical protein
MKKPVDDRPCPTPERGPGSTAPEILDDIDLWVRKDYQKTVYITALVMLVGFLLFYAVKGEIEIRRLEAAVADPRLADQFDQDRGNLSDDELAYVGRFLEAVSNNVWIEDENLLARSWVVHVMNRKDKDSPYNKFLRSADEPSDSIAGAGTELPVTNTEGGN